METPTEQPKENPNDLVKVQVERIMYDKGSGEKISEPHIVYLSAKEVDGYIKTATDALGYTCKIIE